MSTELAAAKRAALLAAKNASNHFGKINLSYKDHVANAVTIADRQNQRLIVDEIRRAFPSSGFLGEEDDLDTLGHGLNWIIDPIDGTTNFGHGISNYAISIAAYHGTSPLVGVIVFPATNEMFFAEKGKGAFCNNQPLRLKKPRPLFRSYIYCETTHDPKKKKEVFRKLPFWIGKVGGIRLLGSNVMSLAFTAANRSDGFVAFGTTPWDLAAGNVILMEAGGALINLKGEPWSFGDSMAIGGPVTRVRELVKILKPLYK
jgi:myo-inositol-1(or 4)-monophosphatase